MASIEDFFNEHNKLIKKIGNTDVISGMNPTNLTHVQVLNLKSEVKIVETKLESHNQVLRNLEKIIEHQRTIINLQKANDINAEKSNFDSSLLSLPIKSNAKRTPKNFNSRNENTQSRSNESRKFGAVVRGSEESSSIHVEKAGLNTIVDMVLEHLKAKLPDTTFCLDKLPERKTANSSPFKVGTDSDHMEELYKNEN
ncbi:hypothetical protein HHI36_012931 [Cryptolaemus montrouzieri]|uniref:Uncharacterized protein n=1 Tax=Cryptolaemus montrouzieri TaxID=559131 RepID=A0ABD2NGB4_9CUCU